MGLNNFRQIADEIEGAVSAGSGGMDGWQDLIRRAAFKGLCLGYKLGLYDSCDDHIGTGLALKEKEVEDAELEELRSWASKAHEKQKYDNHPYSKHLADVEAVVLKYKHHFTAEQLRLLRRCAWLHDVLEDTPVSFDQLRSVAGPVEASLVQLVTDEPGKNRKERKEKTYPKTRTSPLAVALKLADRIANVENACETKYSLINMYRKEHPDFKKGLKQDGSFNDMWERLDELLK